MTRALRLLVVTGGHPYDEPAFRAMLDALPGIAWTEARYPEAADAFAAGHDALLFYDFRQTLSDAQRAALLNTLRRGIGAVFLHHSIHSQIDWPEYRRIVGGFWSDRPFEMDGATIGPSQACAGQQVEVRVVDRAHPITAGMDGWSWTEEPYARFWVDPAARVLLEAEHQPADRALAWCHRYENSRVVYLQPGHDAIAFGHPQYRLLLERSIRWSVDR
jgi:type 1 glutamine amidotransferase